MTRVNLPPGCAGFKAQDGTRYVAKPGTFVDVADHHMAALKNNDYAIAGLVDAGAEKLFIRKGPEGKWCPHCPCNTIYHGWKKSFITIIGNRSTSRLVLYFRTALFLT